MQKTRTVMAAAMPEAMAEEWMKTHVTAPVIPIRMPKANVML
jgi:hypothetical protein